MKNKHLELWVLSIMVIFLVAVGYFISAGMGVRINSGASNLTQSAIGKLVKKGTQGFSPCKGFDTTIIYALIGSQPQTREIAQNRETPKETSSCLPLLVQASVADPLVGEKVVASGVFKDGVFYATSLTKAVVSASPSVPPIVTGKPTPVEVPMPSSDPFRRILPIEGSN